jgi:N6-adenosine-specific RNA methylase IME4
MVPGGGYVNRPPPGKRNVALRYFSNVVEANTGSHSHKPEVFHELIEKVSEGPRLELFAREK